MVANRVNSEKRKRGCKENSTAPSGSKQISRPLNISSRKPGYSKVLSISQQWPMRINVSPAVSSARLPRLICSPFSAVLGTRLSNDSSREQRKEALSLLNVKKTARVCLIGSKQVLSVSPVYR